MNKQTKTILKSILIIALFIFSVNLVFSTSLPLNTGSSPQAKQGSLAFGGIASSYSGTSLRVLGVTVADNLISVQPAQTAYFQGSVFVDQIKDPALGTGEKIVCVNSTGKLKSCTP